MVALPRSSHCRTAPTSSTSSPPLSATTAGKPATSCWSGPGCTYASSPPPQLRPLPNCTHCRFESPPLSLGRSGACKLVCTPADLFKSLVCLCLWQSCTLACLLSLWVQECPDPDGFVEAVNDLIATAMKVCQVCANGFCFFRNETLTITVMCMLVDRRASR